MKAVGRDTATTYSRVSVLGLGWFFSESPCARLTAVTPLATTGAPAASTKRAEPSAEKMIAPRGDALVQKVQAELSVRPVNGTSLAFKVIAHDAGSENSTLLRG